MDAMKVGGVLCKFRRDDDTEKNYGEHVAGRVDDGLIPIYGPVNGIVQSQQRTKTDEWI
jgi:hypothetical protein